ncbi:MAG: bifunctional pyr operon transcriptional regulator/uracil phosphoribosyltransferase PyrR [Erysipelotrichaceae bacterium]|nr:bifunctional pyr operon transcriptional regulator/uracil phosphoribosyltransferase PyrR [Erysipelotrichaceae bacterium]
MNEKNNLRFKVQLLDEATLFRTMTRLSYEVIEKNSDLSRIVLIGIKTRGVPLAELVKENIYKHTGIELPLATLDIKFYRDDLEKVSLNPLITQEELDVDINGKEVILVDDVIYTGRTVRAAIDAVFDKGRPDKVSLLVLIDRGHRELPIRPDYVGKNIPTAMNEVVSVNIRPVDERNNVELLEKTDD